MKKIETSRIRNGHSGTSAGVDMATGANGTPAPFSTNDQDPLTKTRYQSWNRGIWPDCESGVFGHPGGAR